MRNATTVVALSLFAGLALFAGLWLLVTSVLASFSGWIALAAAFPGGALPIGEVIRRQVYGMGGMQQNGVTNAIAAPPGLYLFPMVLFGFRRAPVLVPWGKVRYRETHKLLWSRWHEVDLGGVTFAKVGDRLLAELRRHGVSVPSDALA